MALEGDPRGRDEGPDGVNSRHGLPVPPEVPRRFRITRLQRYGLPVLFLIPVLGLFGVFGETMATVHGRGAGVAITVQYPTRMHYREALGMQIAITNESGGALDSVVVAIDTAYLDRFANVRITPAPTRPYVVPIGSITPGGSALVAVGLAGEESWRQRGNLTVTTPRGVARVPLSTFVFP